MIREPENIDDACELRDKLQSEIGDLQILIAQVKGQPKKDFLAKREAKVKDLRFIKQWLKENASIGNQTPLIAQAVSRWYDILGTLRGLEEENTRLKSEIAELKIRLSEQLEPKQEIRF